MIFFEEVEAAPTTSAEAAAPGAIPHDVLQLNVGGEAFTTYEILFRDG